MPLQKSVTFNSGLVVSKAYFVVQRIIFEYADINTAKIIVSIFVSKKDYALNRPELDHIEHICRGDAFDEFFGEGLLINKNYTPRRQAYEYLKSLKQYSSAIMV